MVLLKKGKVLVSGKVSDILAQGDVVEVSAAGSPDLTGVLSAYPGVKKIETADGRFSLVFDSTDVAVGKINEYCFSKGIVLDHIALKRKSLETRFFELTEETTPTKRVK